MRRPAAMAALVVLTACAPASPDPAPATTGATPAPTTAVSTIITLPPTTTTTLPPTTTTLILEGEAGAPGIGDPFYPELGNGGYDVAHYDLTLAVDGNTGAIEGTAVITATATQDLSAFNLDFVGLAVDSVLVDGAPAQHTHEGRELVIQLPQTLATGTDFETEVRYAGVPAPESSSVPFSGGWQRRIGLAYVIDEPDGASSWFPVNDHPRDPATFRISIEAPPGLDTVTSGVPVSGLEDPAVPDVWEIPEETAPYLVALAIGDFTRVEQKPAGDVDLVVWHPPDLPAALLEPFAAHADMLAFFSDRFGPYPFDRYGALIIDDADLAAALETQTLSTFGVPALGLGESVVAHELVHQWFGDSVRVDSWSDIWLNEGFATFGQWLWVEERFGVDAYDQSVAEAFALMSGAAFATPESSGEDEAREAFPPPATPEATDLFNPSVYQRGGLALVALRDLVGDEAMFDFLRGWYAHVAGTNTTTDAFLEAVGEVLGEDAGALVAEHLFADLVPDLEGRDLVRGS